MSHSNPLHSPDLHSRHFVISKGKLLKKPRIVNLNKSGITLMDPLSLNEKSHKLIAWSDITEIVLPETSDTEVTIKYSKSDKRNMDCTQRPYLLSCIYDFYKTTDYVTYQVQRLTKSLERAPCTIKVNMASIDRMKEDDEFTRHFFMDIKKIGILKEGNAFMIYMNKLRTHLYFSDQTESIVEKIKKNMKSCLQLDLHVEKLESYDNIYTSKEAGIRTVFSLLVEKQSYSYCLNLEESPITLEEQKQNIASNTSEVSTTPNSLDLSSSQRGKSKSIKLLLTKDGIYESNPLSTIIVSMHRFHDIYSIIRCNSDPEKFIIEYENDHPYIYRSKQREEFLSTIIECCERGKVLVTVKGMPSFKKLRIGQKDVPQAAVEESLLKRIASMKSTMTPQEWYPTIAEFNENFTFNHTSCKDKKAFIVLLSFLKNFTDEDPKSKRKSIVINNTSNSPFMVECMSALMTALMRLLTVQALNELVPTYFSEISGLFKLIQLDDVQTSFTAVRMLRFCIDQVFEHKNEKKEQANKHSLLKEPSVSILFNMLEKRFNDLSKYTLVIHEILSVLELVVHSGVSSTDRNLFQLILQHIAKFMKLCFMLCKESKSLSVPYNASSILRVILQCTTKEKLSKIQTLGLEKTYVIQIIYNALRTNDVPSLINLGDILGYLCEEKKDALEVLKRIFPQDMFTSLNDTRSDPEVKHLCKKIQFGQKRLDSTLLPASTLKGNWPKFMLRTKEDESSVVIIWNSKTRNELLNALQREIYEFERQRGTYPDHDVIWNFEEFSVSYPCLKDEPKIGNFYVRFLLESFSSSGLGKLENIENPREFSELLHHNIMFGSTDQLRIQCLEASTTIYTLYRNEIGAYPYIHHMCHLLKNSKNKDMIFNVIKFLFQLLVNERNVEQFIQHKGIPIIMSLITLIHEKVDSSSDNPKIHADICQACIRVLLRLSTFHTSVDDKNRIVVPSPIAKQIMCDSQFLPHIVQLLAMESSENVFLSTVSLLSELVMHNDLLLPDLYKSGLFYFVFLYETNNFDNAAILLKETHSIQDIDIDDVYTGIGEDLSPSIRSILNGILPRELIHRLKEDQSFQFAQLFVSDIRNPYIIWNSEMRAHLRSRIREHVSDFLVELQSNKHTRFNFKKMDPVKYDQLENEFVIYHYYISNFINTETWPDNMAFENSSNFTEAICSWMHSKLTSPERHQLENRLSDCVRAQLLLVLHSKDPIFKSYPGSSSLVECLKTEKGSSLSEAKALLLYQALELCIQLVTISSKNVSALAELQLVERTSAILEVTLAQINVHNLRSVEEMEEQKKDYYEKRRERLCSVDNTVSDGGKNEGKEADQASEMEISEWVTDGDDYMLSYYNQDEKLLTVIAHSLKLLLHLLQRYQEALLHIAQNSTLVSSLLNCLHLCNGKSPNIIDLALNIVSHMCANTNLQERCFNSGIIIYLLYFTVLYNPHVESTGPIAWKSLEIIKKMAGWFKHEKIQYPANPIVRKGLSQIFPAKLVRSLQNDPDIKIFLQLFLKNIEEPETLWNDSTRQELNNFISSNLNSIANNSFSISSVVDFVYETHQKELISQGIFVRFYNRKSDHKLASSIQFVEKLFQLLKDECKIFFDNQEKDNERVLILVEAIHHAGQRYVEVCQQSSCFAEYLPSLLSLLRADNSSNYEPLYYSMEILYAFLKEGGQALSVSLIKHGIIEKMADFLYSQLKYLENDKLPSGQMSDLVRDNCSSLLYRLFAFDNATALTKARESGLFIYIFEMMAGVFSKREIARRKAAFVLSQLLKDQNTCNICKLYVPAILVDVFASNPRSSIQILEKNHEYPQLIWNDEMRKMMRDTLKQQVLSFYQLLQKDCRAKWLIPDGFCISYKYPKKISDIFVSMYQNHPNYPIANFEKFISDLMDKLMEVQDEYDTSLEIVSSIYTCLGGEYFNKQTSQLMNIHCSKIVALLMKSKGKLQILLVEILSKMSLTKMCIEAMSSIADQFLEAMVSCMKQMPDHTDNCLDILLRSVMKSKNISSKITANSTIFQYISDLFNSPKGPKTKQKCSELVKYLCEEESLLKQAIESQDYYKTYVEFSELPSEDAVFKESLPPPIYTGGILGYMNIHLEEKNENEKESYNLFRQLGDDLYDLIHIKRPAKEVATASLPAVQPPSIPSPQMPPVVPSVSPTADRSQQIVPPPEVESLVLPTPTSNAKVTNTNSSVSNNQHQARAIETAPPVPTPKQDIPPIPQAQVNPAQNNAVVSSPAAALPPPPPPPPPPVVPTPKPTEAIAKPTPKSRPSAKVQDNEPDFLSQIKNREFALKSACPREETQKEEDPSMLSELMNKLSNMRDNMGHNDDEEDEDGDDSHGSFSDQD